MTAKPVLLALGLALIANPSRADSTSRPVVLELFTSQGCSSCPPADALLTEYAKTRPDLLPLAFHVEYWNNLGWRDPFSSQAATARQRLHAARLGDPTIYTPELVVEGAQALVGSDRPAAESAIRGAKARQLTLASLRLIRSGAGEVTIAVGSGTGQGTLLLIGFDPAHVTSVGRGENTGRTLLESNVVRSVESLGQWTGAPFEIRRAMPQGEQLAVLLETSDGRIAGAARLDEAGYIPSARR